MRGALSVAWQLSVKTAAPYTPARPPSSASQANALDVAEPDGVEGPVQEHAHPPVAVEEEQEPEGEQRRPARHANHGVVVAEPAKGAHRLRECDAREQESEAQPG